MSESVGGVGAAAGTWMRRVVPHRPPWVRRCPSSNQSEVRQEEHLFQGREGKSMGSGGTKNLFLRIKKISYPWMCSKVKFDLLLNFSWIGHIRILWMIIAISPHNLKGQWSLKEGHEGVSLNIDLVIMEFVSFGPGNPQSLNTMALYNWHCLLWLNWTTHLWDDSEHKGIT